MTNSRRHLMINLLSDPNSSLMEALDAILDDDTHEHLLLRIETALSKPNTNLIKALMDTLKSVQEEEFLSEQVNKETDLDASPNDQLTKALEEILQYVEGKKELQKTRVETSLGQLNFSSQGGFRGGELWFMGALHRDAKSGLASTDDQEITNDAPQKTNNSQDEAYSNEPNGRLINALNEILEYVNGERKLQTTPVEVKTNTSESPDNTNEPCGSLGNKIYRKTPYIPMKSRYLSNETLNQLAKEFPRGGMLIDILNRLHPELDPNNSYIQKVITHGEEVVLGKEDGYLYLKAKSPVTEL